MIRIEAKAMERWPSVPYSIIGITFNKSFHNSISFLPSVSPRPSLPLLAPFSGKHPPWANRQVGLVAGPGVIKGKIQLNVPMRMSLGCSDAMRLAHNLPDFESS